jgi:protein-tyrosine phosphatase
VIDLHTHILPGVDDGVETEEEAVEVARDAVEQGVDKLVATPHYLADGSNLSVAEIKRRVKELQQVMNEQGIEIEILPGMEIYLTQDLGKKAKNGQLLGLNDSDYLLIELPMNRVPAYTENVLYDLQVLGYQPIIAHPERYSAVQKDPNVVYQWLKSGTLAQLNGGSLLGMFGSRVQETAELLVENNLVQLVASDLHSNNRRRECLGVVGEQLDELDFASDYGVLAETIIANQEVEINGFQRYEEEKGILERMKVVLGM